MVSLQLEFFCRLQTRLKHIQHIFTKNTLQKIHPTNLDKLAPSVFFGFVLIFVKLNKSTNTEIAMLCTCIRTQLYINQLLFGQNFQNGKINLLRRGYGERNDIRLGLKSSGSKQLTFTFYDKSANS